jgi:subtilisin family serine protease
MKKHIIFIVLAVLVLSIAVSAGFEKARVVNLEKKVIKSQHRNSGIIAPVTTESGKEFFLNKGCKVTQNLNKGTAFRCPFVVAENMKDEGFAVEDRILQQHDLESDVQIGADQVWASGVNGIGVVVAVLDTGVDKTHSELGDSVILTDNFMGGSEFDTGGHGTHVSGIVTGNGGYFINGNDATGVAPGAGIIVGRVCNDSGCPESSVIAGIEWAVAQGAQVISMSLGTPNWHTINEDCDTDGGPIVDAVLDASAIGVIVVISAGNEGDMANGISSPACASEAIAVGAVDKSGMMADFSNHGPALDIVAPGVDILSTYSCLAAGDCTSNWYAIGSGTSQAAPHVTGVVALMIEAGIDDVKNALYSTADPINPDSKCYGIKTVGRAGYRITTVKCTSDNYGAGIVDAYEAVNFAPPVCGNSEIETGEECDSENLGDATCGSLGFESGILVCTGCEFDTSACTAPPSCESYCLRLGMDYTSGDCKNKCFDRKGEVEQFDFTCSLSREVCCCN